MSETTMPALFTVLVGDDPVRRLATNHPTTNDCWEVYDQDFGWIESKVHDVRPFIPDGTPVDRIVVLPEVGEVTVDTEGYWHMGDEAIGLEDRGVYPFDVRLHYALVTAAKMTKILAARAAEPKCRKMHGRWSCCRDASHCGAHDTGETEHGRVVWSTPDHDPLAQARERLYRSVNWDHSGATVEVSKSDLAAVVHPPLAATEGGAS
jgi:hypothetical protein